MIKRNDVLDRIVILSRELNDIEYSKSPYLFLEPNHNVKFNDFAYFGINDELIILLGDNLCLTKTALFFTNIDTGDILEEFEYRTILEEEYFQLSTVNDFGELRYEDLQFISRHIDQLASDAKKTIKRLKLDAEEYSANLYKSFIDEITKEIDSEIIEKIRINVKNEEYVPTIDRLTVPYGPKKNDDWKHEYWKMSSASKSSFTRSRK